MPPYFVCEADPDKLWDRPRACGSGTRWLPSLFRGQTVLQKPVSIEMLKDAIDQIIGQHASEEQ